MTTTEIINNGSSLKIINETGSRFVMKAQIREIDVVRDTIIRIDIGEGALYNIFVDQSIVTNPVSTSVDNLRDKIIEMLQSGSVVTGDHLATESKQIEQITEMQTMRSYVSDIRDRINTINDKVFYEPMAVDETNPNMVYYGFTVPGAATREPVWAIQKVTNNKGVLTYQWAAGNRLFDKIWDNRKSLAYS